MEAETRSTSSNAVSSGGGDCKESRTETFLEETIHDESQHHRSLQAPYFSRQRFSTASIATVGTNYDPGTFHRSPTGQQEGTRRFEQETGIKRPSAVEEYKRKVQKETERQEKRRRKEKKENKVDEDKEKLKEKTEPKGGDRRHKIRSAGAEIIRHLRDKKRGEEEEAARKKEKKGEKNEKQEEKKEKKKERR